MSRHDAREPSGRTDRRRKRPGRASLVTPSRVTMLILAALAIVLIVENNRKIEIRLLVPIVTMPLYLALLIMFVLGGLCGALLLTGRRK